MTQASTSSIMDRLLDPVGRCLTPEVARKLVELRADPDVQAEIDELAEKCNEGTISSEERAEYEALIRVGQFVALLQANARRLLA